MKYIIYARKSTESEDRQVLSIDSQIKELKEVAQRLGFDEPTVMRESMSAKEPGRPVFNKLMELAEAGKIDGILCWKLDRLARNPVDGGRIIWSIKSKGFKIITPSQHYSKDEDNTILMYVEFGMAQKYIDDLGKNVKRGNREKLANGGLPGIPPIGYLNKLDDHTIIPDPDRFILVRKMWDRLLAGDRPEQVRQMANEEWGFKTKRFKRIGGNPMNISTIYRMVRNPFYYGIIERKVDGELKRYQGAHQAMITEDEFWQVQKLLGLPTPKPKNKSFSLTGLIRCGECGSAITAEEKIKKSGKKYVYYRCTKKNKNLCCLEKPVKGEILEEAINEVLGGIKLPKEFTDWAIKWLKETNDSECVDRTMIYQSLQQSFNVIQNKLDRLTDILLDNLIEQAEYRTKKNELLLEQKKLKEKIDDTEHRAESWLEKIEKAFDFASVAKLRFEQGTNEDKRAIAIALGSNFKLKNGHLALELNKVWEKFYQMSPGLYKDVESLELNKFGQTKRKAGAFFLQNGSWQGR